MNIIIATSTLKKNRNICDICLEGMDKINEELNELNKGWKNFLFGGKRFFILLRRFAYYNSLINRTIQENDVMIEELKEVQNEE